MNGLVILIISKSHSLRYLNHQSATKLRSLQAVTVNHLSESFLLIILFFFKVPCLEYTCFKEF